MAAFLEMLYDLFKLTVVSLTNKRWKSRNSSTWFAENIQLDKFDCMQTFRMTKHDNDSDSDSDSDNDNDNNKTCNMKKLAMNQ